MNWATIRLIVAAFLALILLARSAEALPPCPSPNPNLTPFANTPTGFKDGCTLPSQGINQIIPQNTTCPAGEAVIAVFQSGFTCGAVVAQIASVSLSNSTFVGGVASGTAIGTITVTMNPASPAFSGTLSVSGANASSFQISGNTLETNGVVPSGSYSINIVATQSGIINSPFTQAESLTAQQTIAAVSLSNTSFSSGSPSGTVVGAISVTMASPSPAFSGSLSLTGTDAGRFQIVGSNLETQGVQTTGTYHINVVATQAGVSGSPFTQPESISAVPQNISSVGLSAVAFQGGAATGTVVGAISTVMSPATPAFSGTYSLSGTNAASFQIVGGNLETNGTVATGTYSINIVATQATAANSPFTQAFTITGFGTAWVTDQTIPMPYYCANQIWINPSTSASGPTGAGKAFGSGGLGTQAAPFLTAGDLFTSQIPIAPGTCINLVNSATLFDSELFGNGSGISHPLNLVGTFTNSPTGFWVIRSTDNTGALVQAKVPGSPLNASAANWVSNNLSANNVGNISIQPPMDYAILDGINFGMDGVGRINLGLPCVQVGSNPSNNVQGGLTHFQARGTYVHGCGAGGFNIAGSDYIDLHNNVISSVAISNPTLQESGISLASSASAPGYVSNGYDDALCTTMNSVCLNFHQVASGNLISDPFEANVATTTDGNCIIIDTNIAPASGTNSGAYLFTALLVNNVGYHCGGAGFYAFNSQHVLFVNNTVINAQFDPHNNGTDRNSFVCFNTVDCKQINNLSYQISANTVVRTTGTGTTLAVDNVAGFLTEFRASSAPNPPPSPTNFINVTVDGIANTVVGVTVDTTNVSTTPGGLSGTFTFGTSVSSPHGNSGVAINAVDLAGGGVGPNDAFGYQILGLGDAEGASFITCVNWSQPVPCPSGNQVTINTTGSTNFWENNITDTINSSVPQPAASAFAGFCGGCAVPPTLTSPPGNNIIATDPLLTTPFFTVSPDYEMQGASVLATGTLCSRGELLTLAGGSPDTAAVMQIDAVSSGHIISYHLFSTGAYPGNSPSTVFTIGSATGSCTGATFTSATFVRTFLATSAPVFTLQGGSPALGAGNGSYCPSHNFFGTARSCPTVNIGAY